MPPRIKQAFIRNEENSEGTNNRGEYTEDGMPMSF